MLLFAGLEGNIALYIVGQKRGCDNRLMSSDKLTIRAQKGWFHNRLYLRCFL